MATMALTSPSPQLLNFSNHLGVCNLDKSIKLHCSTLFINFKSSSKSASTRSVICCSASKAGRKVLVKPVCAVESGLEASITDVGENLLGIKNFEITVESKDEDKMQVRVDVPGKETQIVFEKTLRSLARSAPPVPGFRKDKGGKTSKVPRDFLLRILGEDRVTNFVIQEIVSSTVADYVTKENLTVKDNKINTIQTAEELKSVFVPGNDFGFNATLELEQSESELEQSELELEQSTQESTPESA